MGEVHSEVATVKWTLKLRGWTSPVSAGTQLVNSDRIIRAYLYLKKVILIG